MGLEDRVIAMAGLAGRMNADTLAEMYEDVVEPYRDVLQGLPKIFDQVGEDAAPLAAAFLKTCCDIAERQDVEAQLQRGRQIRAQTRFASLSAYTDAGFSREEAMTLVLADATYVRKAMSDTAASIRRSQSSSD